MSTTTTTAPKRIFIVPYRNRLQQKFFFSNQMSFILENETDYEIYFSHQCDNRHFNRGGTKNVGFLAMKEKYPEHYKDITFIFNDVDTLPFHKIFDYQTKKGIVKHYYGFEYALGGIVVIKGDDFEKINGYPNFWGWGNEDSVLQTRCEKYMLHIDRSEFYKIGSPEILQLFDGVSRLITPREHDLGKADSGADGLNSIHRLTYSIDEDSLNSTDNKYKVDNERIKVINILSFLTNTSFEKNDYYEYDLRESPTKILKPEKGKTDKRVVTTDDWKQIRSVPAFRDPKLQQQQQSPQLQQRQPKNQNQNQNQRYQNQQQQQRPQQQHQQHQQPQYPPNIFSAEYAKVMGVKPRATASANVFPMGYRL